MISLKFKHLVSRSLFKKNHISPVKFYSNRKTPNAAALIIGNEILTGKITETNSHFLSKFLYKKGINLDKIIIVRDDMDDIIEAVNDLRTRHNYVFTSGGIGPTHDDITYEAIAKAFGVPLYLNEETINRMKKFSRVINESRKRMATFPVGSRLFFPSDSKWIPIVIKENVYIFPGVPQLFQDLLINSDSLFENGLNRHICEIFTEVFEGDFAEGLKKIQDIHNDVQIGSYPSFDNSKWKVKLTIEGTDKDVVENVKKKVENFLETFNRNN